ncbi:hypothetical protein [Halovulum dunhuangense]|nr:hypothetical protein [Halovulum dunhuangense]
MKKNGGKLSLKKIGIRDASVFQGFCNKHDRELFSCIENEAFAGRPEQCLTVAYRTMSRELYGKDAGSHLRETLRSADKGFGTFEQVMLQRMLDKIDVSNEAARRELKATYDVLTKAVVDSRPDALSSVVFESAASLPFMFAGAWSPFTDLYGGKLQDGYVDEVLDQVFFSSFAGEERAMICVSWISRDGAPGKVIAEQLWALAEEERASACLQLVVKHVENVFFNPDWFEALDGEHTEHLNRLAGDGLDQMGSVPRMPIRLDLDFQMPLCENSFRVGQHSTPP